MSFLSGASATSLSPVTLVSSSHSIQPTRQPRGRVFQAVHGLAGRLRKWQGGAQAASPAPFTLMRGEHECRTRRAARCRQRMAEATHPFHARFRGAPDADTLARLQRAEQKLQDQTAVQASLRDVLMDQTVRAYMKDVQPRHAAQRQKDLVKLRQGPWGRRAGPAAGPAADAFRATLESATALEASARQVRAIGDACRRDGGVEVSAALVHDLITLLNGMNMLRRHDQDPADFLYPAVKLMVTAQRDNAPGAERAVLRDLLRDTGALRRNHPLGLRAQLVKPRGALEFWRAHHPGAAGNAGAADPAAARLALARDVDGLLDGLAGAARRVLLEDLQTGVPGWAREAQAGLFEEARVLYASACRWRDRELARGADDAILRTPPADVVKHLLEQAVNEAVGTAQAPAGCLSPLLGTLKARLEALDQRIQGALNDRGIDHHSTREEIIALRQTLMQKVLEETGILGEIHRLREIGGRGTDAATATAGTARSRAASHAGGAAPRAAVFGVPDPKIHPQAIKRRRKAKANAQRHIIKMMSACRQRGDKPLSAHKLQALNQAYADLFAIYGPPARDVWMRLVQAEAARLKDRDLHSLNIGKLGPHVQGSGQLTARMADAAARAHSDSLLGDIWTAVRTTSARRGAGPLLKAWCAALSTPAGAARATPLSTHAETLRQRIGALADGSVAVEALLDAALDSLSDAELNVLIRALSPSDGAQAGTLPRSASTQAGTLPRPGTTAAHSFLAQLRTAARTQAEKRMGALRDALVPDFRRALFKQAGTLLAMLDTPAARAVNGALGATLERLIRDAAQQARLAHDQGEHAAAAMTATRFLRTAQGYDVARDLAAPLCREITALHARLDAGIKEIGVAQFRSSAVARAWREQAVDRILRDTGLWDHLDNAVARQVPRAIADDQDDTLSTDGSFETLDAKEQRVSAFKKMANLIRGGLRASVRSTRSVDRDGYALQIGSPQRRHAIGPELDAEGYATIPAYDHVAPDAPAGVRARMAAFDDRSESGDSGIGETDSEASADRPSYDFVYEARPSRERPSYDFVPEARPSRERPSYDFVYEER